MRSTLLLTCALVALLPTTVRAQTRPGRNLSAAAREGLRLAQEGCQSDGFDPSLCDKAMARLREAARRDPSNVDVQLALSQAYWNSAHMEPETSRSRTDLRQRSMGILRKLVDRRTRDARPYWELSLRQKDEAAREPLLKKTVALNPKHPEAYKDLAEVKLKQGKPHEAARSYQRHLKVNPPRERQDTEQSLRFAQQLARARPELAAEVVEETWRATRGESRTERCLRFKDVDPSLYARKPTLRGQVRQVRPYCTNTEHLDRAVELEQQGRLDEALNELERQAATNPKPEGTHVMLERLQLRKGRPDLAAQAATRELRTEPDAKERCERFRKLFPETVRAMEPGTVEVLRRDCGQP
jgi:tetratricopeptide (TPR) repeat protein